jgi:hypothetical protein
MQLLKLSNETVFSGLGELDLIQMTSLTLETDVIKYQFSMLLTYNCSVLQNISNQPTTLAKAESNSLKQCKNMIKEANVTILSIELPLERLLNVTFNLNILPKVQATNSCETSQFEFENICKLSKNCNLTLLEDYLTKYVSQRVR